MTNDTEWVPMLRWTNDPKLKYFEDWLDVMGIPSRRNGESSHAPILEVPADKEGRAWRLVSKKIDGEVFEDMPDDHPVFVTYYKESGYDRT